MVHNAHLPDPADYEWEFETVSDVGVWNLRGWQGFADEDLEAVSRHYRERASEDDITASIAIFGSETNLPKETQEYMGDEWSANGEYAGVDKIGFVSEGITALAVKSQVEVPGADVEKFKDVDAAIEWARN
ncbi:hypothetical protein DVK02_01070 [Halobellus sp. Atlit-31R]|nr:hypothetical protein DVK02_01070 [Halobellus sp. Atlit-31R]